MLGILLDIAALATVAGFIWAGRQLGATRGLTRLLCAVGAATVAVVSEPATTRLLKLLTPWESGAVLVGLILSTVIAYVAIGKLVRPPIETYLAPRIGARDALIGGVAAGLEGLGFAIFMVGLVTLLPGDSFISRAGVQSRISRLTTSVVPVAYKWPLQRMPRFMQALPKSRIGARLQHDGLLPLRDWRERERPTDAGDLLDAINGFRVDRNAAPLQWNRDVAQSMEGYSRRMIRERFFSDVTPSGGQLDARVNASLGALTAIYDPEQTVGIVVWAHSPANAFAAIMRSRRTRGALDNQLLTEAGIGVVDAGWFNGSFYTIGVVGPKLGAGDDSESGEPVEPVTDAGLAAGDATVMPDPDTEPDGQGTGLGDVLGGG